MDEVLFKTILGVFENKARCSGCDKTIENIQQHTVHDKDQGLWYHDDCYEKYKKGLTDHEA